MKASQKVIDTKNEYVDISTSMILDNIINQKFEQKAFEEGIAYISKYAGMIVGLQNVGVNEDGIVEIITNIIKKNE